MRGCLALLGLKWEYTLSRGTRWKLRKPTVGYYYFNSSIAAQIR
ncbi:hypothetical protein THTE_2081 [Thermogutta terrifontis]|jgi:hypothetical protein|uniref:Uncharacterized protein n=1 Tax=Thermogutta terrifontis TaxID=1331910 RepID=A0A286RFF5_9BACT|nr:hypothetical protein THTE_2081 [Thermogutta terrifontis]